MIVILFLHPTYTQSFLRGSIYKSPRLESFTVAVTLTACCSTNSVKAHGAHLLVHCTRVPTAQGKLGEVPCQRKHGLLG